MSEQSNNPVGEAVAVKGQDNEALREVLGKDDPFVNALEKVIAPEINPRFSMDVGSFDIPEHWVSPTRLPGMQQFYPFCDNRVKVSTGKMIEIQPATPEAVAVMEYYLESSVVSPALKKFWTTFMPTAPQTGAVFIYAGLVGDTEAVYIRYEQDHVSPVTFVLPRAELNYFLRTWTDAVTQEYAQTEMEDWCKHKNLYPDFQKKGYKHNVSRLPLSFPLSYFVYGAFGIDEERYTNMVSGDLKVMENIQKELSHRFDKYISDITRFAATLSDKVRFKDHDLMLAFRANDTFTNLVVSLDRVFPKLPEGGQMECGLIPVNVFDWAKEGDNVKVVIRKMERLIDKANAMLDSLKNKLPDNQWCRDFLATKIKERLYASSHFMKEIYKANPTDIQPYVKKVGNDVLTALNERGGNIGLDLSSWIVYQYFSDGRPGVPLIEDGLNFKKDLYNTHTERFMEVLFRYLYQVNSPYIRPYVNRVMADAKDGIPVGTLRPVEK